MNSVTTLIKQIKEKELRIEILTKRSKKQDFEIENVISEVKASTAVKNKLQKEEITKLEKLREREMKHNHLKRKKTVWDMLLESNKAKLEEAETLVEQLQEAVFNNRITYCEDVRNFLDKYDLLLMSFGAGVERIPSVPIQATKAEESGSEKLLKNVASLEKILMDLTREAENIEKNNELKAELVAEPNEGQLFKNLRTSLTEVRNKVKDVETKIATVKEDIEKLMQGHKYQASKQDWMFPHSSTCSNSKNTNGIFIMSQSESSSSSRITSIETRDMDTENYNDVSISTNVPKGILKMKSFTPKIPSAALRNHVLTNGHLDVELTKILSRNYEQYQDSV